MYEYMCLAWVNLFINFEFNGGLGLGVDENALISILGKWHPEQRQSFRKGSRDLFIEDERHFERWDDRFVLQLRHEFLRLKV